MTVTLRTTNFSSRPLGLAQLLITGRRSVTLDLIGKAIYGTAMNQDVKPAPAESAVRHSEATLYSFLEVADRLFEAIADVLARVGLSYAKYEVLEHLRQANEPVTLGALAEGQHCARSNITQLVDRLETEGLVRRVDDPDDRRAVRAELTPDGLALAAEGATQVELVRAQFAASFTAPERLELGRLLAKIR
jgi:DNA-binding MarR family transcriptional regulator